MKLEIENLYVTLKIQHFHLYFNQINECVNISFDWNEKHYELIPHSIVFDEEKSDVIYIQVDKEVNAKDCKALIEDINKAKAEENWTIVSKESDNN